MSAPGGGVLVCLKAPGPTSHDLVGAVRRLAHGVRVGHLGTLDPAAAGVLVLVVGWATRWADYLDTGTKEYRAEVTFGIGTDTADVEGAVVARAPVEASLRDRAGAALLGFVGSQMLAPPAYSAVKVAGTRAYRSARHGALPDGLPPREMRFARLDLLTLTEGAFPVAVLDAEVARGTYMRSLATAWGERLGVPAHLSGLVRTRVGPWAIADAHPWEELAEAAAGRRMASLLLPVDPAVASLPAVAGPVPRDGASAPDGAAGPVRLVSSDGRLLAVARAENGVWRGVRQVGAA